jgi:Calcineurin-like phosphoesterase
MDKTSVRLRLSPEKAAFVDMLANFTDEQIANFMAGGTAPAAATKPATIAAVSHPAPFLTGDISNVIVIGDLHAPFIREGYLEWCLEQQRRWNAGTVIFIGDILDGASYHYHEHDPDGMSVGEEIVATRNALSKVFSMFPVAKCTLGNHDLLVSRKARTAGLSKHFVKSIGEIYDAPPTWDFGYDYTIDAVRYTHGGAGGNADRVTKESRISTVQGHLHTQAGISWHVSERDSLFSLQTGCGIDDKAYAFEYGKPFPRKSVIGCAVVLDKGKTPISLLMPL